MFNKYFQHELHKLRELGKEFAEQHPAAAPMLASESVDPDVERLLEGTAFLTGHLHHKIDDDLPEVIHGLMDIVYPHYLRPVPSLSMVRFSPKPSLLETLRVPAGTFLAATEKDGVKCRFQTCFDLDVHPLRVVSASTQEQEHTHRISLSMALNGITLKQWRGNRFSFFLTGAYAKASDLFAAFTQYLSQITITAQGASDTYALSPSDFTCPGLGKEISLFPYPSQSFSGFSLLQEYFLFPQKFLVFEISGLQKWHKRPETGSFDLVFEFSKPPFDLPRVSAEDFSLFSVPVTNIFPFDAEPVVVDHKRERIRVRPSSKSDRGYQIYSVDKVVGFVQGSVKPMEYSPMDHFAFGTEDQSFYRAVRQISPVTNAYEVYISLAYARKKEAFKQETLTVDLSCTNGSVPESLMPGDICEHTSNSPELLNFSNITAPTASVEPPLEGDTLWRMLSHMSLNLLSLKDTESLRTLLELYIFPDSRDKGTVAANMKRIKGIQDFRMASEDRLIRGMVVRGESIAITVSRDAFASFGDVVVFGSVIDEFFSRYTSINNYTRLRIHESISGETIEWLPRVGNTYLT